MNDGFYLYIGKPVRRHGNRMSVRTTLKQGKVQPGEIMVYVAVKLPDSLFVKPQLRAEIKVDEKSAPPVINAEIITDIQEKLKAQLGYEIQLSVQAP